MKRIKQKLVIMAVSAAVFIWTVVSMVVSDGSNRIYNNQAKGHGADICLDGSTSSIALPDAANMGATYLDSGINIDGWYNDNPRYDAL